jgi:hypothetical protein
MLEPRLLIYVKSIAKKLVLDAFSLNTPIKLLAIY